VNHYWFIYSLCNCPLICKFLSGGSHRWRNWLWEDYAGWYACLRSLQNILCWNTSVCCSFVGSSLSYWKHVFIERKINFVLFCCVLFGVPFGGNTRIMSYIMWKTFVWLGGLQVPQYILDHMWTQKKPCRIICTQPRRISATSGLSCLTRLLLDNGLDQLEFGYAELVSDVL